MSAIFSMFGGAMRGAWGRLMWIAGFAFAILVVIVELVRFGRRTERAEQGARDANAMRDRKRVDDETDDLGHADVDHRLRDRWMRDGD